MVTYVEDEPCTIEVLRVHKERGFAHVGLGEGVLPETSFSVSGPQPVADPDFIPGPVGSGFVSLSSLT